MNASPALRPTLGNGTTSLGAVAVVAPFSGRMLGRSGAHVVLGACLGGVLAYTIPALGRSLPWRRVAATA